MATLRIHGTAIFKRKCLASRNVGPVISKGWGIFKRTHQETETMSLIERSDLEFKNLEIDLNLDSFKNFCSDKRCSSLNEFVSSELFATFLFENNQISLSCCELMYAPPWEGFGEELAACGYDYLRMDSIEEEKAEFYSNFESGEEPEAEKELLERINPENFQVLVHDQCLLEEDGRSFSRDSAENWEIGAHGSILVRGGHFYEDPPLFLGFSRKQQLDAKLYIQGTDSDLVDEKTLFATADHASEVAFIKDIEDLIPESGDVKRKASKAPKLTRDQKRGAWEE